LERSASQQRIHRKVEATEANANDEDAKQEHPPLVRECSVDCTQGHCRERKAHHLPSLQAPHGEPTQWHTEKRSNEMDAEYRTSGRKRNVELLGEDDE
jgi:hypothetical protein